MVIFSGQPGFTQMTNLEIYNQSYLTTNVLEIVSLIRKYSDKPITINHIADFPDPRFLHFKGYGGISTDKGDKIKVWLSDNFPEQVLVHELLHVLLRYEGYPEVHRYIGDVDKYIGKTVADERMSDELQSVFSSTIDHQVIYPRMRSMPELETKEYFEALTQTKGSRKNKQTG